MPSVFWRKREPKTVGLDWLIFGLGNPGPQYAHTRHNVGWWVLDELQRRHKPQRSTHRLQSSVDYVSLEGPSGRLGAALVKPTTFMNLSGRSIKQWLREFPAASWAVIYDEIDLPPGKLRLRERGSAGGHKGARSIIDALGTQEFLRVRVGVGKPPAGEDAADYVLDAPGRDELTLIEDSVREAADLLEVLVRDGVEAGQRWMAQRGNPPG